MLSVSTAIPMRKLGFTAPSYHPKGRHFIAQMLLFHSLGDFSINYVLNYITKIPQDTNETTVDAKYIVLKKINVHSMTQCFFFTLKKKVKVKYRPQHETQIQLVPLWT